MLCVCVSVCVRTCKEFPRRGGDLLEEASGVCLFACDPRMEAIDTHTKIGDLDWGMEGEALFGRVEFAFFFSDGVEPFDGSGVAVGDITITGREDDHLVVFLEDELGQNVWVAFV